MQFERVNDSESSISFSDQIPLNDVDAEVLTLDDDHSETASPYETANKTHYTYSQLILPLYLPNIFFATAESALLPIVPFFILHSLNKSATMVGVAYTIKGVGVLLSNVYMGRANSILGTKWRMVLAEFFRATSALIIFFFPFWKILIPAMFLEGISESGWNISRMLFISEYTALTDRGRLASLLGAIRRMGYFFGAHNRRVCHGQVWAESGISSSFCIITSRFSHCINMLSEHAHLPELRESTPQKHTVDM